MKRNNIILMLIILVPLFVNAQSNMLKRSMEATIFTSGKYHESMLKLFEAIESIDSKVIKSDESRTLQGGQSFSVLLNTNDEGYKKIDVMLKELGYVSFVNIIEEGIENLGDTSRLKKDIRFYERKKNKIELQLTKVQEMHNNYYSLWSRLLMVEQKLYLAQAEVSRVKDKSSLHHTLELHLSE